MNVARATSLRTSADGYKGVLLTKVWHNPNLGDRGAELTRKPKIKPKKASENVIKMLLHTGSCVRASGINVI